MSPSSGPLFSNEQYEIRRARNSDEYKALWWANMQGLGWNRGYYDLETYMDCSVGSGMLLLIDKIAGVPVGHVAAVANANQTGWISMFIIQEQHRGKGMGGELFRAALLDADMSGAKILGLDGVAEQKSTYERRQFVESPLGTVDLVSHKLLSQQPLPSDLNMERRPGTHLVPIRQVPSDLLVAHELKYSGFERPRLWSEQLMWGRPDVFGWAVVSNATPDRVDDILAWTIVRRCSGGGRIGPIYAADAQSAKIVLVKAMQTVDAKYIASVPLPNEPISGLPEREIEATGTLVMEIWSGNPEIVALVEAMGWVKRLSYHRMWVDSKATPEQSEGGLGHKVIFAVFDAAIG